MTPEALLANITTLLTGLMLPLGGLGAAVAVVVYGVGKWTDSPNSIRWAKNAAMGAVALLGGSAGINLLKYLGSRAWGA